MNQLSKAGAYAPIRKAAERVARKYRVDADDLVQEVYLEFLERRIDIDTNIGLAITRLKYRGLNKVMPSKIEEVPVDWNDLLDAGPLVESPEDVIVGDAFVAEVFEIVERILARFSSLSGATARMYYLDGRNLRDIASTLGTSENVVSQRLFNVRKALSPAERTIVLAWDAYRRAGTAGRRPARP